MNDDLIRRLTTGAHLTPKVQMDAADVIRGLHQTRSEDFARRVEVEQFLLDCAGGKRPLPDRESCRALAHRLGIPDDYRESRTLLGRARDALNGMIGLVQLVSDRRYPDFPVDNHRVVEAMSCARALEPFSVLNQGGV
jgi:hypothetical protein